MTSSLVAALSSKASWIAPVRASRKIKSGEPGREPGSVSWAEHEAAWKVWSKQQGGNTSDAIQVASAGGFFYSELVHCLGRPPTTWVARVPATKTVVTTPSLFGSVPWESDSWAVFSTDDPDTAPYRYMLGRVWNPKLPLISFTMLNPSTADASINDPTIRRCLGFAMAWGFGSIVVTNVFALRSPKPSALKKAGVEPIGPDNDNFIELATQRAQVCVAAWGKYATKPKPLRARPPKVIELITRHQDLHAIRILGSGEPEHPLYLPGDLKLVLHTRKQAG